VTQPVQEVTSDRAQAATDFRVRQLARRPPLVGESCCPIFFRALIANVEDPEANRVHYIAEDEGDNVYWTDWDPSFDDTVYDVGGPAGPYRQTNDPDEGEVLAGVRLLKRGLYSIHAIVDVYPVFNGTSLFKSNYDEGQGEFRYHNNLAPPSPNYYGDLYGIRLDHWRFVEFDQDTHPFDDFDSTMGGEAETCEIVLAVNTGINLEAGQVEGAVDGGSPGDDIWIPGGPDIPSGGWGLVPQLLIAYWGEGDTDPDWPGSVLGT